MIKENYNITFNEAKQMKQYHFINNTKYSMSELRQEIIDNSGIYIDVAIFILEFGNIDIELNVLSVDDNYYDIGYFVCIKSNDEWESDDYTDRIFNIKDLDNIEEIMYNELMIYASNHNLYWSKGN